MNANQLKEVRNIGAILRSAYYELRIIHLQLTHDFEENYLSMDGDDLLSRQLLEAKDLSLAELNIHTIAYQTIKDVHYVLSKKNGLAEQTIIDGTDELTKQAMIVLNILYNQLGVEMDDYEETKELNRLIEEIKQFDRIVDINDNPFK